MFSGIPEQEVYPLRETRSNYALPVQGHRKGKVFIQHASEIDVNSRDV